METFYAQITNYLLAQSWQIAVLAAVVGVVSFAAKGRSAHVRYLLWLVVLAKCLVPPLFAIPLAVLPAEKQAKPVQASPIAVSSAFVNATDAVGVEPFALPAVTTPPEPTITERLASIGVRQWLGFGWMIGAVVFALAIFLKVVWTNRWLRSIRKPLPAELQSRIENLFVDLGIKRFPRVWLIEGAGQPFVWGLLRGNIYLPANFSRTGNDEHRRSVLGHELSHILRFDAAINLLQIIAQAVYWFHPLVWWANKKIRAEREKCCDEMAIARLGAKAKEFSTAIVNTLVAEHQTLLPVPSLAVAGPVKNIEDRIKTMMRPGKKFRKRPSFVVVISTFLLAVIAVPTTLALTRRAGPKPTDATQVVKDMVGTWFFDNPAGDEEQMAIFPDGQVVVLYSNGHKDKVRYNDGFVELPEYNNAKAKMVLKDKDTLLQFFTYTETGETAKKWTRISTEPHTNLLRSLTGGEAKDESAEELKILGKALIVCANDDDAGRYPNTLPELVEGDYMSRADFDWALENVEYLGKGKTAADDPGMPLAYDKRLLEEGDGTNVLYNDSHVAFEKGERLKRLGIGIRGSLTEPMGFMIPANKFVTGMAILTDRPPKALDLETGRTAELRDSWPSDFDIAWDNDAGGVLMRRPDEWTTQAWQGPVRMLALEGAGNVGEAFVLGRERLQELGQSDVRGVPAKTSRFILVQTSDGNIVVVEIHDFDRHRAFLTWKFLRGHGVHQDSGQRRRRVRRPPRRTNNEPVLAEPADGPQIKFGMRVLQIPADLGQIDDKLPDDLKDYLAGRHPKENCVTIDSEQVDRLLKWVSTLKDAEMLATPTVVVLSGEAATIRIETENGYIAGYDESAGGEPQPQYETVSDGVAFMVKGQVLADNNAIDTQVDFNYNKVEGFDNYTYKQGYPYQQPILSTTQTRTRVVIPDGGSVLLAGAKLQFEADEKTGKKLLLLVTGKKLGDEAPE